MRSKEITAEPLTNWLDGDLVEKASKEMGLKPMKLYSQDKGNPTMLTGDPKIMVQRDNLIVKTGEVTVGVPPVLFL